MDPLTHVLLGATTAQLGFRQRLGAGATWAAVAAAVAPDLDTLAAPLLAAIAAPAGGNHLAVHRGLTHSLLVVPLIAAPIAAPWWGLSRWRLRRKPLDAGAADGAAGGPAAAGSPGCTTQSQDRPRFAVMGACVLAAGLTHPLVDWCTSYGTELLAPLTDARFALDVLPIIDIIYMPILALTLVGCFLARRMWPGQARRATLAIGWTGFLLSVGYVAAGGIMHAGAIAAARPLAGAARVVRADAYPALGTILLWRTVLETERAWIVARVRPISTGPRPRSETAPRQASPWIDRARLMPRVKSYEWFAMGRVRAAYCRQDGLHVVEFHDMRYGAGTDSVDSLWPLRVTFDDAGNLRSIQSMSYRPRGGWGELLRSALRSLWEP
jgi:inner membrane protein